MKVNFKGFEVKKGTFCKMSGMCLFYIYFYPIASAGVSLFLSLAVCFCAITSS